MINNDTLKNEDLWAAFDEVEDEFNEESYSDSSESTSEQMSEEQADPTVCSSCSSQSLIEEEGMIICEDCGTENGILIDYHAEWRFYGADDSKHGVDPTRCGGPINPLLPNASMSTILVGNGSQKFQNIVKWNSMTYKERSLLRVFKEIQTKSADSDIPVCSSDRAKVMYKTLSEESVKRGKSRKGLIAACLYYSCKDKGASRSTKELSKIFDLKVKKMSNGCKQFQEIMYHNNEDYVATIQPTTAEDFIDRYAGAMSEKWREVSKHVANMSTQLGILTENTPPSVAVAAIYMVSQEFELGVVKKDLADKCEISEVTITKSHKKLLPYKRFLLPEGLKA